MNVVCIIPARYESTRFPGKPLCDINGKPMIWWVYNQCKKVKEFQQVIVATDDCRIYDACRSLQLDVVMTSVDNKTGTDRVAEVALSLDADIIVNVQGDEPLIEPCTIIEVIRTLENSDAMVASLMSKIDYPIDLINPTICKAITNSEGYCLYLTRSPAPYPKSKLDVDYYKALGIFAFKKEALRFFKEYGQLYGKSRLESIEDIELLRFIENNYRVKFSISNSKSIFFSSSYNEIN